MIESRCGLICSTCPFKQSHSCGGCVETRGNPFYGGCHIAKCCQDKGYSHCGECNIIPCKDLYAYSYLDTEHGDKPQGARITNCLKWAAEGGIQKWGRVLLTSAGFVSPDGQVNDNIKNKFLELLGMPSGEARVLFVPTATISDEAKYYAGLCKDELIEAGIKAENITEHDVDGSLTEAGAMGFDVIYLTGGSTSHLLQKIKQTGFNNIN